MRLAKLLPRRLTSRVEGEPYEPPQDDPPQGDVRCDIRLGEVVRRAPNYQLGDLGFQQRLLLFPFARHAH